MKVTTDYGNYSIISYESKTAKTLGHQLAAAVIAKHGRSGADIDHMKKLVTAMVDQLSSNILEVALDEIESSAIKKVKG